MIRKCLFPAAGYGTRFLPATKAMPKEMLPIVNKPLVQYGVEEAIDAGLFEIGFVTGRGKRAIADHFDVNYELEHQIEGTSKEKYLECIRSVMDKGRFSFTHQRAMRGLGDAILTGERLVGDKPFGVVLSDDLCFGENNGASDGVMAQMVKASALGRMGTDAEVAAVAAFLVSDAASFMTGTDVLVDGGAIRFA